MKWGSINGENFWASASHSQTKVTLCPRFQPLKLFLNHNFGWRFTEENKYLIPNICNIDGCSIDTQSDIWIMIFDFMSLVLLMVFLSVLFFSILMESVNTLSGWKVIDVTGLTVTFAQFHNEM